MNNKIVPPPHVLAICITLFFSVLFSTIYILGLNNINIIDVNRFIDYLWHINIIPILQIIGVVSVIIILSIIIRYSFLILIVCKTTKPRSLLISFYIGLLVVTILYLCNQTVNIVNPMFEIDIAPLTYPAIASLVFISLCFEYSIAYNDFYNKKIKMAFINFMYTILTPKVYRKDRFYFKTSKFNDEIKFRLVDTFISDLDDNCLCYSIYYINSSKFTEKERNICEQIFKEIDFLRKKYGEDIIKKDDSYHDVISFLELRGVII